MSDGFAWLTEHSLEIQAKYAGKWVAASGEGIIGVGDLATEAAAQAEANCPGVKFTLEAVEREPADLHLDLGIHDYSID